MPVAGLRLVAQLQHSIQDRVPCCLCKSMGSDDDFGFPDIGEPAFGVDTEGVLAAGADRIDCATGDPVPVKLHEESELRSSAVPGRAMSSTDTWLPDAPVSLSPRSQAACQWRTGMPKWLDCSSAWWGRAREK